MEHLGTLTYTTPHAAVRGIYDLIRAEHLPADGGQAVITIERFNEDWNSTHPAIIITGHCKAAVSLSPVTYNDAIERERTYIHFPTPSGAPIKAYREATDRKVLAVTDHEEDALIEAVLTALSAANIDETAPQLKAA